MSAAVTIIWLLEEISKALVTQYEASELLNVFFSVLIKKEDHKQCICGMDKYLFAA